MQSDYSIGLNFRQFTVNPCDHSLPYNQQTQTPITATQPISYNKVSVEDRLTAIERDIADIKRILELIQWRV